MNTRFASQFNGFHFLSRRVVNSSGKDRLHKGFEFLQKHCYEPITVGDLVKASAMSRRGWHKAFRKHTRQSPGRELRRLRIEHAKDLLVNSEHKLEAIAPLCGFRNVNGFWVAFRQATGKSPGKYRTARLVAKKDADTSRVAGTWQ
jgi:transcriptional regulator GlxA family with amidase domain